MQFYPKFTKTVILSNTTPVRNLWAGIFRQKTRHLIRQHLTCSQICKYVRQVTKGVGKVCGRAGGCDLLEHCHLPIRATTRMIAVTKTLHPDSEIDNK